MNNVLFTFVNDKQNTYIEKNIQKSIYVATLANYCVIFTKKRHYCFVLKKVHQF